MISQKHRSDTSINFSAFYLSIIIIYSVFTSCSDLNSLPTLPLKYPNVLEGQVYNLSHPGPIPVDWVAPPYENVCTVIIQDVDQGIKQEANTDSKGKFRIMVQDGNYFLRVKESILSSVTGPYHASNGSTINVKAYFDNGMR
ncbi:MAG: hypothetical protein NTX65_14425 [Ignavibacteriales bacterium]|nr:hypothetical protein [Ignavibacteriales bacterium]